ncbi:alpha/beta fold hydrolase [Granulosicoccus sp. 3-233]|uniref:alpha/beta fold hydrolase n=1 Tax=Granulosicoccus sp. 3-233 TaxID=3417969 RepID=UPI003D326BA0
MKIRMNDADVFVGQGGVAWEAGRRTLLLQHGAGMNRTVWVLLARYLARHGFNLVCADLPAHGASGGEALTSIESQADFIWQLLDELQANHALPAEPVILGGHSMGALIATEAAGQQPQRVEQLLLFGSGFPMPVAQPLLDAAAANEQTAVDMITIYGHCLKSQLGHNPVAGISVQNTAMAMLEGCAPGVLHADLSACNAYQGLDAAAAAFGQGKATLIAGAEDRMTPMKMSRNLVEQLGGELVVLADCGHMVMSEQPEQTLQAARRALS